MPTGKMPTGKIPTGKMPTGKISTGKMPTGMAMYDSSSASDRFFAYYILFSILPVCTHMWRPLLLPSIPVKYFADDKICIPDLVKTQMVGPTKSLLEHCKHPKKALQLQKTPLILGCLLKIGTNLFDQSTLLLTHSE